MDGNDAAVCSSCNTGFAKTSANACISKSFFECVIFLRKFDKTYITILTLVHREILRKVSSILLM